MTSNARSTAQADDLAIVRLSGLGVRYGDNQVLQGVELAIHPGTITALLGTNGAGKSTLIGAVSGAGASYTGEIAVAGEIVRLSSPARARRAGIETVHQRIADGIVPDLSVADNLVLTDLTSRGHRLVRRRRTEDAARDALARLGLAWSDEVLRADAGRLSASDAQLLILARALRSTPRLLILDEPTSALTAAEADRLFDVLRALRDEGLAILFVSHRFGEIERLADRILVLRDGRLELDANRPFDWHVALEAMLGVPTELQQHITDPMPAGEAVITVAGATLLPGAPPLEFTVYSGQVTGILGLLGAGKTELAELIAGVRVDPAASLTFAGAAFRPTTPVAAIDAGIALVPEERQRQGIQPGWSIARTVGLPVLGEISRLGVVSSPRERAVADEVIGTFGVVAPSNATPLDELSGGNQQKVIVGRWLRTRPTLAVMDEPFRGVDIGARRRIGDAARTRAAEGGAVVVLSSDVDEILDVADRIVVLVGGRIVLDTTAGAHDRTRIVNALLGDAEHPKETA